MNSALFQYTAANFDSFRELLNHLPEVKEEHEPTFLEIAGFPNYENVFSNLYQFFLEEKQHNLGRIFLEALSKLLPDENLSLQEYVVEREVYTNAGGRIDIVIKEKSSKDNEQKVILIENKVYHCLDNNLEDYFTTFPKADRTGIVLSLEKMEVPKPFYNITHLDWLKEVEKLLGASFHRAHPKYLVLLQDFIQHIRTYYQQSHSMEAYRFIYNEGSKISKLIHFQDEIFNHLISEIQRILPETGWQWNRVSGWQGSISKENGKLHLYLDLSEVFSERKFIITLWFRGEKLVNEWNATPFYKRTQDVEKKHGITLNVESSAYKAWAKIAHKEYSITTPEEYQHFGNKVKELITGEWEELVWELMKNYKI